MKGNLQDDGTYDGRPVIPEGVTLLLPYGNATDATGRNQSGKATLTNATGYREQDLTRVWITNSIKDAQGNYIRGEWTGAMSNGDPYTYCKTLVILGENVSLSVNGTLEIAGELSGGGGGHLSGHTGGKYASLKLKAGATINVKNKGVVKCYGFVENSDDNSSADGKLTIEYGAHIYLPFVLVDFKGGTIMSALQDGMEKYGYAPFHQFHFPNVSTVLRFNYGGQLTAWCNLNAGDQINDTERLIIGSGTDSFLQLTDPDHSYLEAKYDPETNITDLKIFGGAQLNNLSLTTQGVTVNSYDFVFGFSWLYNITLDQGDEQTATAEYLMPYDYKMLPGSSLTIEAGAKLTVNGVLTVYDNTFEDRLGGIYPYTGIYPVYYPKDSSYYTGATVNINGTIYTVGDGGTRLPSAKLTVRGSLKAGTLAGDVYTDTLGATVEVTEKTRYTSYEPTVIVRPSLTGKVTDYQTVTRVLKLIYSYTENGEIKYNEQKAVFPNAVFESRDVGGNKNWYTDTELTWITITIPSSTLPEGAYIIVDSTVNLDENGVFTGMGSYDSRTATSHTISVIPGTSIIYHLQANHIADIENDGTETVSSGNVKQEAYELDVEATSGMSVPKVYVIPVFKITISNIDECTVTYKNLSTNPSATIVAKKGYLDTGGLLNTVKISITASGDYSKTWSKEGKQTVTTTATIENLQNDMTINFVGTQEVKDDGCVTPDTLVTLADGTQKRIDQLTYDDQILVWNFYTGKYDVSTASILMNHGYSNVNIVTLKFADGTTINTINGHGFFDVNINKFVLIDQYNVADYVGHEFVKQDGNGYANTELIGYSIEEKYTEVVSILTSEHYNCILEGMWTITAAEVDNSPEWLMPYEIGEDMKYDESKMQSDIEKYGLYTYEDFEEYCTYEQFVALRLDNFKVSVGKGYITWDEIEYLISIHIG